MKARVFSLASVLCLAIFAGVEQALAAVGAPRDWQVNLPDSVTPILDQMKSFNELLLIIIVAIVLFVLGLLVWVMIRYSESANPVPSRLSHNTTLEVLWTIVPGAHPGRDRHPFLQASVPSVRLSESRRGCESDRQAVVLVLRISRRRRSPSTPIPSTTRI